MTEQLTDSRRGLFISLSLSLAALAIVLFITVDENTIASVARLRPEYLAAAFLMVILLWVTEGLRIKSIAWALGHPGSLKLWEAMRVFLVTFFFAGVTPLAIGEWPAQIYYLNRLGLTSGEAAAVSLVRAFFTKCSVVFAAVVLILADGRVLQGTSPVFVLFRYAVWVVTATVLLYLLIIWRAGFVVTLIQRISRISWLQRKCRQKPRFARWLERIQTETCRFSDTISHIDRKKTLRLVWPILLTVIYWGIYYSIAPVLLAGFGVLSVIKTAIMWQVMIMLVLPYVPVPGGSGAVEFGLATLFASFVPASVLGVFIVVWRLFTYYLTLIFGAVFAFRVSRKIPTAK